MLVPFDYLCIHTNGCNGPGLTTLPCSIDLELRLTRLTRLTRHHRETLQEKKKMYIYIENHIEMRKTEATCVSVSGLSSDLSGNAEKTHTKKSRCLGKLSV